MKSSYEQQQAAISKPYACKNAQIILTGLYV